MEINRGRYPLLQKPHPTQVPQNSSLMIPFQLIKSVDQLLLTTGYLTVAQHTTIHPFTATFKALEPASLAYGTTKISTFKGTTNCYFTTDEGQRSILSLTNVYLSHRLLSLTAISATQNFTVVIRHCATTICFPNNSKYAWPLLLHELVLAAQ
jgi:hypothetical protein